MFWYELIDFIFMIVDIVINLLEKPFKKKSKRGENKMKTLYAVLLTVSFLIFGSWLTVRIYDGYQFDKNVAGHLKRAADANTVVMAKDELKTALNYIEQNNLTSGSTYIIFDTPDKDIGFWYKNLKSSYGGLSTLSSNASELEKSNMLMKLRETLTDNEGKDGTSITVPGGISIYPHNLLFAAWGWISGILFILLIIIGLVMLASL